jgi:DNA polymerase-3 subunit epsilon
MNTNFKYPTIIVDCETTGLELVEGHFAIEVAWWNLATGERDCFIPPHSVTLALRIGDPMALEMNNYRMRIPMAAQDISGRLASELENQLRGSTLAGSNPRFDTGFLVPRVLRPVWHHRLLDLSAYAMGILGLDYLPGLADVCERLGVSAPNHTAEGDVSATGLCLGILREWATQPRRVTGE